MPRWATGSERQLRLRMAEHARFTTTLAAHGIDLRPARTAALMALAEQLPAAVLGPLLGLRSQTAVAWTTLVKRDWTDCIAARTTSPTPEVEH